MIHRRQRMIWTFIILVAVAVAAGNITVHFTGKNQQTSNTTRAMVSRPAKQVSTLSALPSRFTPLGISFSDESRGMIYGLTETGDEVAAVTHDGGKSWTSILQTSLTAMGSTLSSRDRLTPHLASFRRRMEGNTGRR